MNLKNILKAISSIIITILIIGCGNHEQTKLNGSELKQEEFAFKEGQISLQEKQAKSNQSEENPAIKNDKKELRYLYHANGGLTGFFDDGTIVGCPRCDFCRPNILILFNEEPTGTYEVQPDGSLLINNSAKKIPDYKDDNGWALVDYKWNKKVPQSC